jgi:hypothetical protein
MVHTKTRRYEGELVGCGRVIPEPIKNDSSLKTVRAELVEALSFSFNALPEEKQPFDKLRANGDELGSSSFGISTVRRAV